MKINSILYIVILLSCKEGHNVRSIPCIDSKTESSNENIIDTLLIDKSNLQDRTVWQRPYDIINMLGPLEDKIIADIGSGSGYFSFKFVHNAKKVIAIDIEPELINLMNEEKNYYKEDIQSKFEARLAKTNDPMLKNDEVDIVFLSNTYCYLSNRVNYLQNLISKIKRGGKIMIVDFKKKITPIGPTLESRLAQGEVEKELLDAGYQIEMSDDSTLKYQFIIIASPIVK